MNSPLLGICAGLEAAPAIKAAGADFLEVSVQSVLVPREDEARFAPLLAAALALPVPIRCANLFLPTALPCVGPAVDEPALLAYAATAFERAHRVGIRRIVFGSGGARNVPEGFPLAQAQAQFVGFLKQIAPVAARAEVVLVIEALNPRDCNFINTLAQGAEIVEACDHLGVALVADVYHMGFSGEGPDALRRYGQYLRHMHVAGYPARKYPGADGQSLRDVFQALRETGYQDDVSVECNWGTLDQEGPTAVANVRRDLAAAGWTAGA